MLIPSKLFLEKFSSWVKIQLKRHLLYEAFLILPEKHFLRPVHSPPDSGPHAGLKLSPLMEVSQQCFPSISRRLIFQKILASDEWADSQLETSAVGMGGGKRVKVPTGMTNHDPLPSGQIFALGQVRGHWLEASGGHLEDPGSPPSPGGGTLCYFLP